LPIDASIVKRDEELNDGVYVNLYFYEEWSLWVAYAHSAYNLRMLAKNNSLDCICLFSDRLQMPCSMISDNVLRLLKERVESKVEKIDLGLRFETSLPFSNNDYIRWAHKLNQAKTISQAEIETPVHKLVPTEGFIYDGMSGFARNTKRLFDCFFAFIAMLIFSPLYLICFVLIKREDGGPAIFKQERIGRFGRPFYIYKFRSMHLDAEKMGPQLSVSGGIKDPRLTKIGAFIRAHHLDELPQLYNVFVGDMSFVGPRPERKFYIDQIMEYDKRYIYLYQIRPGVTSPATLYNGYTDTMAKMLSRLEWDLYYLGHRSWWLDISILFKTFCRIIFGKIF
jgi:lipopolysaccharide/colanic/teichoic acid biosynthesis glycosyltransferase